MLPPAPVPSNVVVGVTIVKRFPGYGVHRGTIAELDIDGGKVLVHWSTTDERTTLSLTEAAKRVVASPLADEEDDDQSVTSAAFGIELGDELHRAQRCFARGCAAPRAARTRRRGRPALDRRRHDRRV